MQPQLARQCARWMGGRSDLGEEAFSRATLRALQRFPRLRASIADPRGWFARLTYRVCMDLHRELACVASANGGDPDHLDRLMPLARSPRDDPETALLHRERSDALRGAVARLPWRLRVPVEMLLLDESDSQTIADALRISPAAVRKRLQEGRDRMRADLTSDGRRRRTRTDTVGRPADPRTTPLFTALTLATIELPSGALREVELLQEAPPAVSSRAIARLERYVTRFGTGWKKRIELARAYVAAGRSAEAIVQYQRAADRVPAPVAAVFELVELLMAGRALSAAREVCERAVWRSDRWLGDALLASIAGDVEGLREALADAPRDPHASLLAGRIALQTGLAGDAVGYLGRAPRSAVAMALLADAFAATRRTAAETAAVLAEALRQAPHERALLARVRRTDVSAPRPLHATEWRCYAGALTASGRPVAAFAAAWHAMQLDGQDAHSALLSAQCALATARPSETRALLRRLLSAPVPCDVALAAAELVAAVSPDAELTEAALAAVAVHRGVAAAIDASEALVGAQQVARTRPHES
jgi:RNA polymerase sigma factor (sigma-70 family)